MPFVSKQQSRWAHSSTGVKALGGKEKVAEWSGATDYSKLPDKASQKGALSKAAMKAKNG